MLSNDQLRELLQPYTTTISDETLTLLLAYIELVMQWNARTNLTAIRTAEQLAQRQVGESLLASQFLDGVTSLLDFGSGAGFPGIPLALCQSSLHVTLAESQGKKAAFLREAVRTLGLNADVWSGRVELMPAERTFQVVVMRAVDKTAAMLPLAEARVAASGSLLRYVSATETLESNGWKLLDQVAVPLSDGKLVSLTRSGA